MQKSLFSTMEEWSQTAPILKAAPLGNGCMPISKRDEEMSRLAPAVMWHGAAMIPKLRAMSFEERRALLLEFEESGKAESAPLWMQLSQKELEKLTFRNWQAGKQLSGIETIALMVFLLWVQCGENPNVAAPIVATWPIREALILVDGTQSVAERFKDGES